MVANLAPENEILVYPRDGVSRSRGKEIYLLEPHDGATLGMRVM